MSRFIKLPNGETIEERRMNGSGVNKLTFWFMTFAFGVVVFGGGMWLSNAQSTLNIHEATLASRGERIATLETNYKAISDRLLRIESKLDIMADKVTELYRDSENSRVQRKNK